MKLPKANLHIHSNYSDGKNSIKRIVKRALKLGLDYIAITDHFSNSWKADIINTLNSKEKIKNYLDEISVFQEYIANNNLGLKLLKGIEIDLGSSEEYIKEFVQPAKFDLILFEYLETLEGIKFIKIIINYWKESNLKMKNKPIFALAHFDPSYFIDKALDRLIDFLSKYEIYYEFNTRYPEFYSTKYELFFDELKKENIPTTIGSDSHNLMRLDDIDEGLKRVKYFNLQDNYLTLLSLLKKL